MTGVPTEVIRSQPVSQKLSRAPLKGSSGLAMVEAEHATDAGRRLT